MRRLLVLVALLVPAALCAPATALALAPPAEFDADKYEARTNESISFTIRTVDPTPGTTYSWDFGDAVTGTTESVTHSYTTAGTYTVTVTATNLLGESSTASQSVTITDPPPPPPVNTPPTASFTISNDQPVVGETISVFSTSKDAEDALTCEWTAADGAIGDPGACTTTITWPTAGTKRVSLRVTEARPGGISAEVLDRIKVTTLPPPANKPPNAPSLSYSPAAPVAGQLVSFTSKATDPDGTIETYEWDFDSDNVYEASGETAGHVFTAAGNYTVTVRATDNNGGSKTSFQTIFVSSPPTGEILGTSNSGSPPSASTPLSGQGQPRQPARLLSPFPVVRLRGSVVGRTARINLLSIQGAPRGAKVRVRCRGGGCPRKLVTSTARSSRRTMRLRSFERRLAAGATLEIYITQSGRLGKYTRFEIRRNAAPRRTDRCVRSFPGKPVACPDAS